MTIRVGDRVRVVADGPWRDWIGTVEEVADQPLGVEVRLDGWPGTIPFDRSELVYTS